MNHLEAFVVVLFQLKLVITNPIHAPQFPPGILSGFGTKNRDVSCVSTRTGESGFCMFAAACQRANGTHLSTCIDRFYFGSCCKLDNRPQVHHQGNTIETGPRPGPQVTGTGIIESNDIADDYLTPKPFSEKKPMTLTTNQMIVESVTTVTNTSSVSMEPSVNSSTLKTVEEFPEQSSNAVTTNDVLQEAPNGSTRPQMGSSVTPTSSDNFNDLEEPEITTRKPTSFNVIEQSTMKKPISTPRPLLPTVDDRIPTATRFPPRNATKTTTLSDIFASTESTVIMKRPTSLTPSKISLVFNGTVLTNEIPIPVKVPTTTLTHVDDEEYKPVLHPSGIVTWSSWVNDRVTTTSTIITTPSTTPHNEPTDNGASTESYLSLETVVTTSSSMNNDDDNLAGLFKPTENFTTLDYKRVCGRRILPESRIVGGSYSSFGKWPWQISLQTWNSSSSSFRHWCGAALLTNTWAITAAHCVENIHLKFLLLIIGDYDIKENIEPYESVERRVQFVFRHNKFDPLTYENDVAILRFDKPLTTFRPNIQPICLPEDDDYHVGHMVHVTGWGKLRYDGRSPSILQEVSLPIMNNEICEEMYRTAGFRERIPDIFLCAGRREGGVDSCEGDSGGPMVIQRPSDERWILVGVTSWGIGCATPNQPGVYTRISKFRKWIVESIELIDRAFQEK